MQIINKSAPEYIIHNPRLGAPRITFRSDGRKIYFSKSAVIRFKMKENQRIHFVADFDRLYFFINTDPAGSRLVSDGGSVLKINDMALVATLKNKFPYKISNGNCFDLKASPTKVNECNTVEILLNTRRKSLKHKL